MAEGKPTEDEDAKALRSIAASLKDEQQAAVMQAADRLATLSRLEADDRKTSTAWKWIVGIGAVVVLLGLIHYLRLMLTDAGWNHAPQFGQLGDALGPVAGLLSALAVGVALWSVRLQSRDLALQREELRETRKEMKVQADHLKESAGAQNRLAQSQESLAKAQEDANRLLKKQTETQAVGTYIAIELAVIKAYIDTITTPEPTERLHALVLKQIANGGSPAEMVVAQLDALKSLVSDYVQESSGARAQKAQQSESENA